MTERSCRLLFHKTDSYTAQSATESTVTTDKDGGAVPMSLDWLSIMLRVPNNTASTTTLQSTTSRPEQSTHGNIAGEKSSLRSRSDPKPLQYADEQSDEQRGPEKHTEYSATGYGYGVD